MITDRAKYIEGLHQLANLIETNPGMPIPHDIERDNVGWYIQGTIGDALAIKAVMDDPKITRSDSATFPVDITGTIAGMPARVQIVDRLALAANETVTLPAMNPLLTEPVSA